MQPLIQYNGPLTEQLCNFFQNGLTQDYDKSPRPLLDEGQIDDMEQLLSESLTNKTLLEITTWKDGYFNSRIGLVIKIDPHTKKILIQDELDSFSTIDFFHITNVTIK